MAKREQPVASVVTAIRTAAAEATKEDIPGAEYNQRRKNLASVATVYTGGMVRQGQYSGMSGGMGMGNTNYSLPNQYSPFLTTQAFTVPTNRKEVYLWAQWFYDNEPKVAAAIEFYTDFPVSGFTLECSNGYVKDYFEELSKKLNFAKWLPLISLEYHLRGDVFIMMSIDCQHCHGSNYDEDTDEECKHEGATWKSITCLNPDQVEITPHFLDQEPSFMLHSDDAMLKIVMEQQPKKIYDSIPPMIRQKILAKEPIELSPTSIFHLKRGTSAYNPYGISIIKRLFQTLAYKDKLRQAQWLVAERHIIPIKIVKIGSDLRPASSEDIQNVQEELTNVANDPSLTLVTHNNFDFEFVGAEGKVLNLTPDFEQIDQDIIDGMMLNKSIINGDGPSYSNAQVGLITMAKRLEKFRTELAYWMEERVFKPIAQWNGFTSEGKRGQEELIYPTVKWDDLELRDDTGKLQVLQQAQKDGVISAQTFMEAIEVDYDQEVERLRMEQLANMVSQQGSPSSGMGAGYGGAAPSGGGGGGAPGGMPDMGGGGAPPDGGAPGGAPGGAEPPMGGGAEGGAPAPGAMASSRTPEENYRFAANTMNDVYNYNVEQSGFNYRYAQQSYMSVAHEYFVKSMRPVTGRGNIGPLPLNNNETIQLIQDVPVNGGEESIPLNRSASREVAHLTATGKIQERTVYAKKNDGPIQPRKLFSKLEQKLYEIVLNMNMPYPFYAQYEAGPGMEYQLDGAIPQLKLGIEADSETFHNSPQKIASDKRRDMQLATQGWTVLRFTESEILEKPQEIASVVMQTIRRLSGQGGSAGQIVI